MMATFMCQLGWAKDDQILGLAFFLDISVRVFKMRLTFELVNCVKTIALPSVWGLINALKV